jgi:hypothetical protein
MEATIPSEKLGLVLRIGLYAFLAYAGLMLFFTLLAPTGILIAGAVGTFLAAAAANAITVRIFERGRLSDMGLGWDYRSLRNIGLGVSSGILAAAVFLAPAVRSCICTAGSRLSGEFFCLHLSDVRPVIRRIRGRNAFPRVRFSDADRRIGSVFRLASHQPPVRLCARGESRDLLARAD